MKRSILITGIAGSGKSTVCDELKKLGHKAYDIERIEGLFMMVSRKTKKKFENYDNANFKMVKQADWLCDKKKLEQLMQKDSKRTVFYCGTADNLDDLLPLFDKIFLLKASQKELRKRLSTRTSNDFGRTAEVQRWIFSRKKQWEDNVREKGAIVIDANRKLSKIVRDIIKKSKQ